jgi:hypothetical protein
MRTPRGPSRSLWSLHRAVSTSDVLFVALRHARAGIRFRPMRFSGSRVLAEPMSGVDLRARGPLRRRAGESPTGRCPRTPFVVSRACRPRPASHTCGELFVLARVHTISPSTHPRPASGGATDFLPASVLAHQLVLRPSGEEERVMRPTDVCHPNELRALAPRVFPARSHHFRSEGTSRRLRLRAALPGIQTFHDVRDRFGGSSFDTRLMPSTSRPLEHERGHLPPTVPLRSSL